MDLEETLKGTYDAMTVRRVYGDPIEHDGVIVIPAAAIRGGLGHGGGHDANGNEGGGGGGGVSARPVGVYRIEGGNVTWQPAVDVTRIAVLGEVLVIVLLLVVRSVMRRRRKR
ncbi:MAG TPA: spore germination protein GerW family protein [Acidimicrobiia bacterium]